MFAVRSPDSAVPGAPTEPPLTASPPRPLPAWHEGVRAPLEALAVAVVVALVLLVARLPYEMRLPGAFNDDGVYLALGRALASGEGYRSVHLVGAPLQVKFPPGLPALYALLWAVGGTLERVAALASLLGALAAGAGAGLVWWLGRARVMLAPGALATLTVPPFLLVASVDYYTLPLTEPWFVLGWAGVLALAAHAGRRGWAVSHALMLGALVAVMVLVRTQAVTLLPALLLALALERRWRPAAACLASAMVPLGAWHLWLARAGADEPPVVVPDEAAYTDWVPGGDAGTAMVALARAAAGNVESYAVNLANHLGRPAWTGGVMLLVFAALAIAGAVALRRTQRPLVLSVALALLLLLLWPSPQDRLILPVLPFAGLLAAAGAGRVAKLARLPAVPPRALRLAVVAVAALAVGRTAVRQVEIRATLRVGLSGKGTPRFRTSSWFLPRNSRMIASVAGWARTGAGPGDRMLTALPSGTWLHTGRLTMPGEPNESVLERSVWAVPGDYLRRRIRDEGITLVVVDAPNRPLARDLRVLGERCPGAFTNVAAGPFDGFPAVFRVHATDRCLRTLLDAPARA